MTGLVSLIILTLFADNAAAVTSQIDMEQLDHMKGLLQEMNKRVEYLELKMKRDEVPATSRLFERVVSDKENDNNTSQIDLGKYLMSNPTGYKLINMITDQVEPNSAKSRDTKFREVHRVRRRRQASAEKRNRSLENSIKTHLNEVIQRVTDLHNKTWENSDDVERMLRYVMYNNQNIHSELHAIHEDLENISMLLKDSDTHSSSYEIDSGNTGTTPTVKMSEIQVTANSVVRVPPYATDTATEPRNFTSCSDVMKSYTANGLYQIYVLGTLMDVYCDQRTDKGGWVVIQRRIDGTVDFNRKWLDYKEGFGQMNREFWIGNEKLCLLSRSGSCELRVDMVKLDGSFMHAKYSVFKMLPEATKYQLNVGGYSGDAGDNLSYHNGMKFSTLDADNDRNQLGNCALLWKGGWWYNNCYRVHPNGVHSDELSDLTNMERMRWGPTLLQKVTVKVRCQ